MKPYGYMHHIAVSSFVVWNTQTPFSWGPVSSQVFCGMENADTVLRVGGPQINEMPPLSFYVFLLYKRRRHGTGGGSIGNGIGIGKDRKGNEAVLGRD